jgi:hypothetical protein
MMAELAVVPLHNQLHIKVDGKVRYITTVKIKEASSDGVVLVEVV